MGQIAKMYINGGIYIYNQLYNRLLSARKKNIITIDEYYQYFLKLQNEDEETIEYVVANFEEDTTDL